MNTVSLRWCREC